tara:strand:- start:144 stop:254 length:111 start_codon:yes stop_codon:yes gene_type:complete
MLARYKEVTDNLLILEKYEELDKTPKEIDGLDKIEL